MNYWSTLPAYAATTNDIGKSLGLSDANLVDVVIRVMNIVLGFAPLVAVSFLIIGGFQWMTSAGQEDRVERAKKTISAAVIGLVIILLAWAVVTFVAKTTLNVSSVPTNAESNR